MSRELSFQYRGNYIVNLHQLRRWYRLFHPMVASVIVVPDPKNRYNLMPAVWAYPISAREPYIAVGVAPERYTFSLLREASEFTVSILPSTESRLIRELGDVSGKDVNKLERFHLELEDPLSNSVPHIKGSIAWVEAKLEEVIERANWDHALFIGRVLIAAANKLAFDETELIWKLDSPEHTPASWLGGDFFVKLVQSEKVR